MGDDACYLPLVDVDGRLREGPVLAWPSDGDQEPPPGRAIAVESDDPSEARLQFLENLAREDRLVLLYEEGHREAAERIAAALLERLKKK
jgi:hypothetical protein